MNKQEAIDLLEDISQGNGAVFEVSKDLAGASKTAISALEKQIPKKIKYEDSGYDHYNNVNIYACICPSCGLHIIYFNDEDVNDNYDGDDIEKMFHSSLVHHDYKGLNSFCNRCGQKLDWNGEDI